VLFEVWLREAELFNVALENQLLLMQQFTHDCELIEVHLDSETALKITLRIKPHSLTLIQNLMILYS
jgi:hypothetical protein